jgi:hypothetical protein
VLTIADSSEDIWRDTLTFPVRPLKTTVYTSPLKHVEGAATGGFDIAIVDSTMVKNHLYVIRGTAPQGSAGGYLVKGSTTGIVLLEDHPLPDLLGHTSPVIDGLKVLIGTIDPRPGMRSRAISSGVRRFSPVGGYAGLGLEGFSTAADLAAYDQTRGTIGMAGHLVFAGIGTPLGTSDYDDVLLKLAPVSNLVLWEPKATPADGNFSRAYRYLSNADASPAESSFTPWIVNASAVSRIKDTTTPCRSQRGIWRPIHRHALQWDAWRTMWRADLWMGATGRALPPGTTVWHASSHSSSGRRTRRHPIRRLRWI